MKTFCTIVLAWATFHAIGQTSNVITITSRSATIESDSIQQLIIRGDSLKQLTIETLQIPKIRFGVLPAPTPGEDCQALQSSAIVLEFNADGQMVSYPPEQLLSGQYLQARVNLDDIFWLKRKHEVIDRYLTTLANLGNRALIFKPFDFGIDDAELLALKNELAYELRTYLPNSGMDRAHINYYTAKISYTAPGTRPTTNYIPHINTLIDPVFRITYRFFNIDGNRINNAGNLLCISEPTPPPLRQCCARVSDTRGYYLSEPVQIPPNTYSIEYDLTLENALVQQVMTKTSAIPAFPTELKQILANAESISRRYNYLVAEVEKLKAAPNPARYAALVDTLRDITDAKVTLMARINSYPNTPAAGVAASAKREWIKHWLWYTKGTPKIDPFAATENVPVPANDKARYELFEMILNKDGFKLDAMNTFTDNLGRLPDIKAALAKEASALKPGEANQDFLLYKGIFKATQNVYMRHHDVKNDYIVMGIMPRREINELQRLYVLLANKAPSVKFSISLTTSEINTDLSVISEELLTKANELADNADAGTPKDLLNENIAALIVGVATLEDDIKALRALGTTPAYPKLYESDTTPTYVTDALEHDYFFEAPVFVNYSIKSVAADNTEKEVKASTYRVNKLYRLRFKAGLVYSTLKNKDFTNTGPNQFSLSDPTYGIDGTFGVQGYFRKQDIRQQTGLKLHAFGGLSMKKITENFYFGIGIEPWSGVAIDVTAHVGKREKLVGQSGIPTDIRQTFGVAPGLTVLIDAFLFTKIFTFGNNKSLLGF
jgi:hypothetical protein